MRRASTFIAIAAFAASLAGAADAAPCKDAQGKFTKCPAPAARCRDKVSKNFAKCGAPNTEPVPMKSAMAPAPMKTAAAPAPAKKK